MISLKTNVCMFRPSWSSSVNNNHHAFITKPKPQPHLRPQYTISPSSTSTTTSLLQTTTSTTTTTTPPPTMISTPTTTPAPTTITTTSKPLIISTVGSVDMAATIVPGKPEKHTAKPGVSAETNQKSIRTRYCPLNKMTLV